MNLQPDQNHSIFRRIKSNMSRLGNAGRKVGNAVLLHSNDIIHLSVSELAAKVGVSEATVVRFCQDVGFKGYQDFKIHLSQALVVPVKGFDSNIEVGDTVKTMMAKISQTTVRTITDTLDVITEESLEVAVNLLQEASRIAVFGVGGSGIIAQDAEHKFMKLGLPVAAHSDPHNALQACSVMGEKDVLFAISYSGRTRDVLKVAKLAKQNGLSIISITKLAKTPLVKISDVSLFTSSPESQYRSEGVCSRVAQLCIIDALFVGIYVSNQQRYGELLAKARNSLSDSRC